MNGLRNIVGFMITVLCFCIGGREGLVGASLDPSISALGSGP
ncbi:MAG: hypothetical protein RL230_887 [Pseudomonadota bacterium]|jgi:hypothetical protein